MRALIKTATAALALAGAAALAAPASAQDPAYVSAPYVSAWGYDNTVSEVVVVGPNGPNGRTHLSQTISYADLDLTTYAGRDMLSHRIRATARDLCRALGEGSDNGGPLLRSCEQQARIDARPQVRIATDNAYRRASYAYAYLSGYDPLLD